MTLLSRYVYQAPGAQSVIPAASIGRFSSYPTNIVTSQTVLSDSERCIPLWGLTARGIYQAMSVQTLAISVSSIPTSSDAAARSLSENYKRRMFHFNVHKGDGLVEGEDTNNASPGFLSLDFRDFTRTLSM